MYTKGKVYSLFVPPKTDRMMIMWKKLIITCITLMSVLSFGFFYKELNAAGLSSSGGIISGNLGPLKAGNRFYIYTNNYPFVVVGNDAGASNLGTLALTDEALGSILWDSGSNYYSSSRYRVFIQDMNRTIDSRDVNTIIKEFVKPNLPDLATNYYTHDLNALPSNEMPYFIGAPWFIACKGGVPGVSESDLEPYLITGTWMGPPVTNG